MNIQTKIYFWLYKIYAKWILKVRNRIKSLIFYKVQRICLVDYSTYKINTINDIAVFYERYLINGELDEDKLEKIDDIVDDVERVKLALLENKDIKELLSNYHRATHFYYSYFSSGSFLNEIEGSKEKAIKYNSEFKDLNTQSIKELDKSIRKGIKLSVKENGAIIKEIIDNDVNDATPKLELDTSKVNFIISLSASLFLVTGYFYNKYYLEHFGIEVSDFYTIGDYLASSLDKISIAIFSTLFSVGFYLAGIYRGLKKYITAEHYNEQVESSDISMSILIISVSGMLVYASYVGHPLAGVLMNLLLTLTAMAIIFIIPLEKFISNHFQVNVALVAITFFSINIYQEIRSEISQVTDNEYKSSYVVVFSNNLFSDKNDIRLIASTSSFYFFYVPKSRSSYVVKKTDVSIIQTKKS